MTPMQTDSHWLRTIGVVTTTRADYGVYRPLLSALVASDRYRLIRYVGGTHLSAEFGATRDDVRRDPHGEIVEVDYLVPHDDAASIAASAGAAFGAFGRAFSNRPVDLLFLLGDRYEMLSAAIAAALHRIPIAHLHGGDVTAGSLDDAFRHAISKLAALHFPALLEHAERLKRIGEAPWRIDVCGALALDALTGFTPEPIDAVSAAIGLDLRRPTAVVCVHPETLSSAPATALFDPIARGLDAFEGNVLVIGPNADEGFHKLRDAMQGYAGARPRARFVASLPQERFWSLLSHAAVLVGNSSAGIIEAASFKLPVVNVGSRQAGRARAPNVIDVTWDPAAISAAIARAASPAFRASLASLTNPWGDGRAAERIVGALHCIPPRERLLVKSESIPEGVGA